MNGAHGLIFGGKIIKRSPNQEGIPVKYWLSATPQRLPAWVKETNLK